MSGSKLLVDTNVALYLMGGDQTLVNLLEGKHLHISFITQLELLGFKNISEKEEKGIREFINGCTVIDINTRIKEQVVNLRKEYNIKLPDSIIIATSQYLDLPIITSDKGFKKVTSLDLLYYEKTV